MIAHSIGAAQKSGLFDVIMVSTDDEEIAAISKQFGAKVPFLRSASNSDDFSGTGDVMGEVLDAYAAQGEKFDEACCIYATAPLITEARIRESLDLLEKSDYDATFPVGRFSSPIWRSYKLSDDSAASMNFPEFEKSPRSQDLPQAYYDAGQFYWFYPNNLKIIPNKNSFGVNKGAIILQEHEVQDIDEPSDWCMAELKYNYLKSLNL